MYNTHLQPFRTGFAARSGASFLCASLYTNHGATPAAHEATTEQGIGGHRGVLPFRKCGSSGAVSGNVHADWQHDDCAHWPYGYLAAER